VLLRYSEHRFLTTDKTDLFSQNGTDYLCKSVYESVKICG